MQCFNLHDKETIINDVGLKNGNIELTHLTRISLHPLIETENKTLQWLDVDSNLKLYGNHYEIIEKIAKKHKANWKSE